MPISKFKPNWNNMPNAQAISERVFIVDNIDKHKFSASDCKALGKPYTTITHEKKFVDNMTL